MKRAGTFAIAFGALLAIFVVSAGAESLSTVTTAKVPFGFTVGNLALPAGEYSIQSLTSGTVVVRNDRTKERGVALGRVQTSKRETSAKLVFNRYGENYFLSAIDLFGDRTISFGVSKTEQEFRKNSSKSVAEVKRQPEVIQIALAAVR
jgi:hypothetical protein